MNRIQWPFRIAAMVLMLGLVGWLVAQIVAPAPSPVGLLPGGAILVLEAPDLSRLVQDWAASPEQSNWSGSTAAKVFSTSRLGSRLAEVAASYAASTGFASTLDWLKSVAGAESTLAIYDVGRLEFVYITRLSAARAEATSLMRNRTSFTPRQVEGRTFYVKAVEKGSGRAAFAVTDGWLIAGTRDDLVAGVIAAIANKLPAGLAQEPWFRDAAKSAERTAELRMYLMMPALAQDPRARAYWIQRNSRDWQSSAWALVESRRTPSAIEERRVLKRREDVPSEAPVRGLTAAMGLGSGLVSVVGAPSEQQVIGWLQSRLLSPRTGAAGPSRQAPVIAALGTVGSESDLETPIDQSPPTLSDASIDVTGLTNLVAGRTLTTLVTWDGAEANPDGVLFRWQPAMALEADADWKADAVEQALSLAVARRFAARSITWQTQGRLHVAEGLVPLVWATRGRWLFMGTTVSRVNQLLDAPWGPSTSRVTFASRLHLQPEATRFSTLMAQLDDAALRAAQGEDRQPLLFSETVASLLRVAGRVELIDLQEESAGDRVTQRLSYSFHRP